MISPVSTTHLTRLRTASSDGLIAAFPEAMVHVFSPDFAIEAIQLVVVIRDVVTVTGQEELIMIRSSRTDRIRWRFRRWNARRQPARPDSKCDIVVGSGRTRRRWPGRLRGSLSLIVGIRHSAAGPGTEKLQALADHFESIALLSRLLVLPGIEAQATFDEYRAAFLGILAGDFGEASPKLDIDVGDFLDLFAALLV